MNSDVQVLFQRRTEELFRSLGEQLNAQELCDMRASVAEGDHAEVIRALAWNIEKKGNSVSRLVKMEICDLSRDLVDLRDMPESFRAMLLVKQMANQSPQPIRASGPLG